jgi:aryl-alcohol dehydrogenase-like predicted oxidoreductase
MPVFAYSSMARGFFSGRVTRERFMAEQGHFLDPGVLFSGIAEWPFRPSARFCSLRDVQSLKKSLTQDPGQVALVASAGVTCPTSSTSVRARLRFPGPCAGQCARGFP